MNINMLVSYTCNTVCVCVCVFLLLEMQNASPRILRYMCPMEAALVHLIIYFNIFVKRSQSHHHLIRYSSFLVSSHINPTF